MNKNIKDIIIIGLLAFVFILLPTLINYSSVERKTDTFFRRVDENFNDCIKNANEEPRDIRLCKEIKRASELSFNSATRISDSYSSFSVSPIILLFFLVIVTLDLRRRIEDLEKK
jgi:hypothetical protein